MVSHAQTDEQMLIEKNSIDTWDEYYTYLQENQTQNNSGNSKLAEAIEDVETHLTSNYPNYYWFCDKDRSSLTSDVSSSIPIEMQAIGFYSEEELNEAIKKSRY